MNVIKVLYCIYCVIASLIGIWFFVSYLDVVITPLRYWWNFFDIVLS